MYPWPDIQLAFQLLEKYKTAKGNFMGKAFRDGELETQIEKELKERFEEVDMTVSFCTYTNWERA